MSASGKPEKLVGARLRRREDPRFLLGRGRYVDDMQRPGLLHVAFVRSDLPHAKLKSVDAARARNVAGVVGVFAAADLAALVSPIKVVSAASPHSACEMPPLAQGRVRYVGEPVAAVAAYSRYEAEDGAEAVGVEYEPLPVVTEIEDALGEDAPRLHESIEGNAYNRFRIATGDVAAAFEQADHRMAFTFRSQRCAPVCLEARVVLAEWDPAGSALAVWCPHQTPHRYRSGLAALLGIPESRIRVISPDVGGGFGSKGALYAEDLAVVAIARLTGRPVKWTSDRREDLLTSLHGREQVHRIEAAVRRDGRVLGLRAVIKANNGAYAAWPVTAALDSGQASENLPGPYAIAAYEREVFAVATNKAPMGPYRGVGRVMACFTMERAIDEIARRLELDPLEVRRRNVVRDYPYDTAGGLRLESGSSAESLDRMERLLDLPRLRREHAALRSQGVYRGIGFSASVEHTSPGPHYLARKGGAVVAGMESALIRIEPDGAVTVLVGTHSHGQGHETTFAQIVSDELDVPIDGVQIRFGDTASVPYGVGTFASRSLVYGGGAIMLASEAIKGKMKAIAAHRLEVAAEDLEFVPGGVRIRGVPGIAMTFAEIAHTATNRPDLLPAEMDPGLEAIRHYRAPDPGTFSNSLHAAIVEVDAETGIVRILRYVVIEDCGTMVNPTIVEGQVHGGVAQGIGHALLENAYYDADGQPLAATLADYLVPSFTDVPRIEVHHIETPSPAGLGGFKGMAEGGSINAPAAIANAVADALSSFGILVDRTPITPEWIVKAVERARRDSS